MVPSSKRTPCNFNLQVNLHLHPIKDTSKTQT